MRALAGCGLLAACGGGPDVGDVDAGAQGRNPVILSAPDAAFVSYRDGLGPWLVPEAVSDDAYALHVTDDYEVVVVCVDDDGSDAGLSARTWPDGPDLEWPCVYEPPDDPFPEREPVTVTGQMIQPGTVRLIGDSATSDTAPWGFSLDVEPGMHDLFAVTADRVLLRRDLQIDEATTLGDLDVEQEGALVDSVPLLLNGIAGDETITTDNYWLTDHGFLTLSWTGQEAVRPPPSLISPGDRELLFVDVTTDTTWRFADTWFTGGVAVFDMPAVPSITFATEGIAASWTSLPLDGDVWFSVYTGAARLGVYPSDRWLAATGGQELSFPTDLDGFDPAWLVDLEARYTRVFGVSGDVGGIYYSAGIVEPVNGAALRTGPAPRRRRSG